MAEIDDLRKQLEDLNKQIKEAGGLGINFDEAIKKAGSDVKVLQTYIAQLNKQLNDTVNNSEYVYRTFQDLTSELKNQNLLLKAGKNSFKVFTDIAQDLNYYQKGTNDLTDKQFERIKQNIGLEKEELKFVVEKLKASEISRQREAKALSDLGNERTSIQNVRLKELLKENELLINANEALISGLPILEKELNLSKKISDSRKELGGATKAAADLLSKYGGSLAQFFNISDASKAVEEYNKDLIKSTLQNKDLQNELLNIEGKKFNVGKKLEENLNRVHKLGLRKETTDKLSAIYQASAQEELNRLDQKQVDLKDEAINKTITLGNKYKSLEIFVGELGKGLEKALKDPVVRFAISLGLLKSAFNDVKKGVNFFKEFDTSLASTSRSLGLAKESVNTLLRNVATSQGRLGALTNSQGALISQNVYSANQIFQALSDVNNQLGLSLNLSEDTVFEFAQMTQTMGLTAEEASKIYKLSVLNNQSLKNTNKSIAEGIISAQKATGIRINEKQVYQEIGKLSAGITAKFQQNPKAIAEAVVQAKALGTSLETIDKIGESLLNFELSIENQLKAQLLTGKQLNLEKARYAALTGNQLDLEKEIADQVGSLADFQSMNVIAQKSLAEAFGLSRDELADMLQKQEVFNRLGDISGKTTAEQLKIAREKGLTETDSLVVNLKQQSVAEQLDATFNNIKSVLASIVDGPLGTMAKYIANVLTNTRAMGAILGLMAFGTILKMVAGLGSALKLMRDLRIATKGTAIAQAIATAMANPLQALAGVAIAGVVAAGVGALLAGSNADDFKSIGDNNGGYGKRTLLTPEGTFKINNKDTILGGTDKSLSTPSPSIGINKPQIPMANYGITKEDFKETINDMLNGILGRPQPAPTFIFEGNGAQLGKFIGSQSETGTAQNISTSYKVA